MRKQIFLLALLSSLAAVAALPWTDRPNVPREGIEWQDAWIEGGDKTDAALPRVLLLGDSISRQYRGKVSELLKGKTRVANSAGSHCVGDPMLAAARKLPVVDLYAAIMQDPANYFSGDATHFNDKGVNVMAEKIVDAFNNLR